MLRTFSAALLCMLAFTVSAVSQPKYEKPSDIPVEAFAALPTFSSAQLSPSGKKIGYYISIDGRRHLLVQHLDGSNQRVVPPWNDKMEMSKFLWKSDDLIVFQIRMTLDRVMFRTKTTETRTVSFNLATNEFKWLGKPRKNKNENTSQLERIVDYLPNEPNHILVALDFKLDATPDVYRVNVETGRRKLKQRGRPGINSWYTDQNSEVRYGDGYKPRKSEFNITFKNSDGKWIDLDQQEWTGAYDVEGFSEDQNILYVSGLSPYGTQGLFKLDIHTGKVTERVFAHEKVDMGSIFFHPVTGRLAGVTYTDDFHRIKYFDEDFALLQRSLSRVLPGQNISIVSKARDVEQYLVVAESDTNPGDYYFYNRPKKQLSWVAAHRQPIDAKLMAAVKPVSIPVRDGDEIPAYLTMPNTETPQNLPTIILPHGGPHARDNAGWDWWSQFYASRGYLVLQPNFRGSDGYGPTFRKKGEKQWGGLMQDDVTDATKWLISEGYANPSRICIAGASYGGYAALMGIIKEKNLYKCAVSVNGVTDLVRLKSSDKRHSVGGKAWTKKMGLKGIPDKDVSPHHRADEINVPVLLISSKDDARIPYEHSRDLHKKLKKLKKGSEYVMLKNGTHNMLTAESRLITLRETEKFLAKHIGD